MIIYYLLGSYFLFYALYTSLNLGLGYYWKNRYKIPFWKVNTSELEWIVILPAYNPDERFLQVLDSISNAYFDGKLHVYILFQRADEKIVSAAKKYNYIIEENIFYNPAGNPYHDALRHISENIRQWVREGKMNPSHVVLLDKDNLVTKKFFERMALYTDYYEVLQGQRRPLETKTAGQVYDALAESMNDSMMRAAKMQLGSCPEFSGSGLVFPVGTYDYLVNHLDSRAPGMDKNLLIQLLLRGKNESPSVGYIPEAILYEEKTAQIDNLQKQRIRWFGNQYFNALYYTPKLLRKGSWAAIDYAISICRPPRSVHGGMAILGSVVELTLWTAFGFQFIPMFSIGLGITMLGMGAFILEAPAKRISYFSKLVTHTPLIMFNNIKSVWQGIGKKSQGSFIHTERG